jgi:hypothetical protein
LVRGLLGTNMDTDTIKASLSVTVGP